MFGYIKPLTSELKVREFELYKSFYCGLCKTMGKKISRLSRITLSYDMVFLTLLRIALTGENIENLAFRCKLKPTKKRNYIKPNESLLYSTCVAAILSYYKFQDNINDAKNIFKKFFIRIFFPSSLFFSRMRKKARKYYPELDEKIKESLLKLSELEKNKCKSIDETASCFAGLMQEVVSFGLNGLENNNTIKIAEIIGRHLGRWLYIIDALDDFDKDLKTKQYNPFIEYYGEKTKLIKDIELIEFSLTSSLSEITTAFSLIENKESNCVNPIILNIINLGFCSQHSC